MTIWDIAQKNEAKGKINLIKKDNRVAFLAFIFLIAWIVLACNGGGAPAIPTPWPTLTPADTPTPTPWPTRTPLPTATDIPPTPTPVPVGTAVSNGSYKVNVMYSRILQTVYLDQKYHWVPTAGNMFVELGIKAVNLKPGSKVSIAWGAVYITEENGDSWYPSWGEFKEIAGNVKYNPKNLVFRELKDRNEQVIFDDVVYVRAIYGTKKMHPTTLIFGFGESPLIKVVVP